MKLGRDEFMRRLVGSWFADVCGGFPIFPSLPVGSCWICQDPVTNVGWVFLTVAWPQNHNVFHFCFIQWCLRSFNVMRFLF